MIRNILFLAGLLFINACTQKPGLNQVLIKTDKGNILIELYDDTPAHRDNFLKLAGAGAYDQLLFHRVIDSFMIQSGDFDSKNARPGARLGNGGPDYTLEAEIVFPRHFHKRGALAAAREGDDVNPEHRSSGSQFYIVQGKTFDDEGFKKVEKRKADMQNKNIRYKTLEAYKDSLQSLKEAGDHQALMDMRIRIDEIAEDKIAGSPSVAVPDEIRDVYRTLGGAPHLDGSYTVFGEVIEGMDVVDAIASVKRDKYNRPLEDIAIREMLCGPHK